jgi:hypothetical protein
MLQPTSNESSFEIQPLGCYTGLNSVGYLDVGPRDRLQPRAAVRVCYKVLAG